MAKLKKLLEGIFNDKPRINKYEVTEGVRSYGIVGKQLYNNGNILEIAKQLSHIAEQAHSHILGEQDDWFDKVSVNKNMQGLKKNVQEFKKTAVESHQLNQRLTGLYEDIGNVLNRYYEISDDDGELTERARDDRGKEMDQSPNVTNDANTNVNEGGGSHKETDSDRPDYQPNIENDSNINVNEIYKAVRETRNRISKRPIKRLKDINSVVTIPAIGGISKKRRF